MKEYLLGRQIVVFYDQEGLPFELSLDLLKQQGESAALLGILCEAAKRRLTKKVIREAVVAWLAYHQPSTAEAQAAQHFLTENT